MFQTSISLLLGLAAGLCVVVQQALNANLRFALNSAAWSGIANYFVGGACIALLAVAWRDPLPSVALATRIPWWAWAGGMCGTIYLVLSIFLAPKIGAATFFALLVTGQMLGSVTLDHFGWLGLAQRPIDASRLIGVALLIGGVLLIRR